MSVKIHANYHFMKLIKKTCRLNCSSHRGITSVLIVFYFNIRSFGKL